MDLILRAEDPAPPKSSWHQPDSKTRDHWSSIYESITTWFCSSHDFNKEDNLIILYNSSLIKFEGKTIRYLGPSMRSAASLAHKAFVKLETLREDEEIAESTPGIFVYKYANDYELQQPHYQLVLLDKVKKNQKINTSGSLFTFNTKESQKYYSPASRVTQGLVWFLQERYQ